MKRKDRGVCWGQEKPIVGNQVESNPFQLSQASLVAKSLYSKKDMKHQSGV